MERYEAYRDSGVEWIGEIPKGWEIRPVQSLATFNDEALSENTDPDYRFNYIDISSVSEGSIDSYSEQVFSSAPSRARRIIRERDVLVSTVRTYLKAIAFVSEEHAGCVASTGFCVLRPRSDADSRWFGYAVSEESIINQIVARSVGVSYPAINASDLVKLQLRYPPIEEQQAIADYLDVKTAEIDGLVADCEREVELLREYRKAVISEAVTKGLDPDAPMKDSGIEWIGEIPVTWKTARLDKVAIRKSGHTPDKKVPEYWDGDIVWISLADSPRLRENIYVSESTTMTTETGIANSSAELLPAGSVLLSRDASVGLTAIAAVPLAVSQHFMAYICDANLSNEYLRYVFLAMHQEFDRLSMGSTIPTIGLPLIRKLTIPYPSRAAQDNIVTHLNGVVHEIDLLISDNQSMADKLREYRKSLISEAVTGKFKVPGI